MMSVRGFFLAGLLAMAAPAFGFTQPPARGKETEVAKEISYYRDVRPIFVQHCQGCHQPAKPQGGYVMTTHAELLKGGESGETAIVPGKPDKSYLIEQIVAETGEKPKMPRGKDSLPPFQVETIKKWIAQGAKDDTPASARGAVVDDKHPPVYALPPVVTALAFSPDGQYLAVSGYHEILLHKADGTGLAARLVGLSERIQSLAFSPDGKRLAMAGGSPGRFGEVQVWDVEKRKLLLAVPVTFDTVYGVSWNPAGTTIAFGCGDNTLRAIDAESGKQVLYQGAHNDWVLDTVFSINGSHLVSVSRDRSMKLTDVSTQRFVDNITSITPGALKGGLMSVDRHPWKNDLLIGGSDGVPKVYQMYRSRKRVIGDDFNHIKSFDAVPGRIFSARYSPNGMRVVVGSSLEGKGEVRVYESASKPDDRLTMVCGFLSPFSQGHSVLWMLGDLWGSGRLIAKAEGQKGAVYAVAFHPNNQIIASGGFDGMVRLNDAVTGKLIKEFVAAPLSGGVASR